MQNLMEEEVLYNYVERGRVVLNQILVLNSRPRQDPVIQNPSSLSGTGISKSHGILEWILSFQFYLF